MGLVESFLATHRLVVLVTYFIPYHLTFHSLQFTSVHLYCFPIVFLCPSHNVTTCLTSVHKSLFPIALPWYLIISVKDVTTCMSSRWIIYFRTKLHKWGLNGCEGRSTTEKQNLKAICENCPDEKLENGNYTQLQQNLRGFNSTQPNKIQHLKFCYQ